ncbi:MAG TPA: tripartite tricarboxylate transporter substrate binding protein [Hyphomicrobiaceae bacterium]|nr:tripartite tricarboxylate transporter substrate binding protein [Hyphomicrobiaceae bacterium]
MQRRAWLALVAAAASLVGLVAPASGQGSSDFPSRPITLIVPFQAGVSADLLFRGIAESASKHLGQPVIVENKPGGSATLGPATMAATAKPDGYTIGQIAIPVFRVPYMQKATFDPVKDFTYIINLGGYTLGAVVKTDGPFKAWSDVIAFAKANPGKFTYATIGAATTNAIAMELMARQSGVQFTHIPSKGGGESIAAVLGGHVMMMVESPGWAPQVASGDFRLLMLLNGQRSKKWPDTPTLRELGYTYVFDSPFGLAGPKGMDPAIVKKLHDAFKKAYEEEKVIELFDRFDFVRRYMSTEDYQAFVPKLAADEKAALEKVGLAKSE